ncbi:MFS transporter [Georgenia thermotolerans]|uniref:MFS transporter n=1 Tax=Georgenia thermotolerans TaxID=527326 RepID=UPI001478D6E7|nr:MFS transporter [Georgenia thermotolerans]
MPTNQSIETASPSKLRDVEILHGGRAVAVVATLILGILAFQLNASMLTPALPAIGEEFGADGAGLGQVSSLLFLSGAVAGLVLGRWSDFFGRRRMAILILAIVIVGTLMCIVAPNLPVLLVGRVLQGAGSASFPLAYVTLSERMAPKVFGTTLGVITAVNGGVGGLDGYFGGLLAETWGFRSIFVVILIVAVIALIASVVVLPKDVRAASAGAMDWWGALILSIALISLTYFVSEGSNQGWFSPLPLLFLAVAVGAFVVFWKVEQRKTTPLIAVHHLKSRQVWPVVLTTTLTLASVFAVINFTVVLLSQNTDFGYGLDAATAALRYLLPPAIIGVLAAPFAGWFAAKFGWLKAVRIGMVLSIAAVATIALLPTEQGIVLACIALLGISYNGFLLTTANGLGVILSPPEAPSALPGINGAGFGIGVGLGIGIVAPFAGNGTIEGIQTALFISLGITILAFIASMFIKGRPGVKL